MIFSLPAFEMKAVVFIGKGREGKSFEKFIQQHATIQSFRYVDKTDGDDYLEALKELNLEQTIVVKTPGCPGRLVPVPYTTPTRVFFECIKQLGAKTIGITGTKGKTTTSSLLALMIQQTGADVRLRGNMGLPMLDSLVGATEQSVFVLELSSYQLAELEVSPNIAVITNLYRDHIDYHGNLETYWEAKRNIMRYMDASGSVVFSPETEIVLHWLAESKAKSLPIDPEEAAPMEKSKLIGDHNRINYLLAKKAAMALGVDQYSCQTALAHFEPIRHRLQIVRSVKNITYVDDAIATQPEAAIAGITACVRQVGPVGCVMLGGQDRDYDYTELVKLLSTLLIPTLVLFPDTGAKIKSMLPETYTPIIFETRDMAEAVNWAAKHCPSGSVCLLSTAAPSYSVWKDFEEKGDLFQKAVLALSSFS